MTEQALLSKPFYLPPAVGLACTLITIVFVLVKGNFEAVFTGAIFQIALDTTGTWLVIGINAIISVFAAVGIKISSISGSKLAAGMALPLGYIASLFPILSLASLFW
jgi:hypothetical protein